MKRIINGKKYDTDTAREVAVWDNCRDATDFAYVEQHLYRKRTGEYFLYGFGGPHSSYAEHKHGAWQFGSAITPLTDNKARKWGEAHMDVDAYEAEFGEVEE